MLVGVWLGLHWVLFYFFDHYIQSSVHLTKAKYVLLRQVSVTDIYHTIPYHTVQFSSVHLTKDKYVLLRSVQFSTSN